MRWVLMILLAVVLWGESSRASAKEVDPNAFWTKFRNAVLSHNVAQVALLTNFPFEVKGQDDAVPTKYYSKNMFPAVYYKLINQRLLIKYPDGMVLKSMYEVINEKKELQSQDFNTAACIWIHDFQFKLLKEGWYFSRGYLEE